MLGLKASISCKASFEYWISWFMYTFCDYMCAPPHSTVSIAVCLLFGSKYYRAVQCLELKVLLPQPLKFWTFARVPSFSARLIFFSFYFCFYFCFWHRVSCSPDWPLTSNVTKAGLEFLVFYFHLPGPGLEACSINTWPVILFCIY